MPDFGRLVAVPEPIGFGWLGADGLNSWFFFRSFILPFPASPKKNQNKNYNRRKFRIRKLAMPKLSLVVAQYSNLEGWTVIT